MTSSTSEKVNKTDFYLDTCATTHIFSHLNRFKIISPCTGIKTSSLGEKMEVKGQGIVDLNCLVKDRNIKEFIVHNILYVPSQKHILFPCKREITNSYTLFDNGLTQCLINNGEVYLETNVYGPLPVKVVESLCRQDIALVTCDSWHEANVP